MAARTFFFLLALAGSTQAQQFTNLLWPPRDVGANESFGQFSVALDRDLLAVRDARASENPFVRVYKREGLNWIEDARLSVQPRTPVVASSLGDLLDVDDGRVVTADGNAIQLFKRFGERQWAHEEVPAPAGVQGFGRLVSLSADWMAVASNDTVHLLHRGPGGWSVAQELAGRIAFQLELSGANLLLTEAQHVRILHFDGSTWAQELDLGFAENSTPASLDGDRLGLVSRQTFRSYDRVGSSWLPSGSLGFFADGVTLCEGRAYLRSIFPRVVQPIDLVGSSWVPAAVIETPDAALGTFANRVCASGPLVVVSSGGPIVEHIGGTLSTYANDGSRATLRASTAQMTLEDGGTLTLALDAGIANAGKLFFLGGSLSGTSPGTRVNGVRVPLNEHNDPYYRLSLRRGNLDGLGRATVDVVLPAMAPGDALTFLKDRTLHHTFVIWEPQRGITHVANVELTALVGRTH